MQTLEHSNSFPPSDSIPWPDSEDLQVIIIVYFNSESHKVESEFWISQVTYDCHIVNIHLHLCTFL